MLVWSHNVTWRAAPHPPILLSAGCGAPPDPATPPRLTHAAVHCTAAALAQWRGQRGTRPPEGDGTQALTAAPKTQHAAGTSSMVQRLRHAQDQGGWGCARLCTQSTGHPQCPPPALRTGGRRRRQQRMRGTGCLASAVVTSSPGEPTKRCGAATKESCRAWLKDATDAMWRRGHSASPPPLKVLDSENTTKRPNHTLAPTRAHTRTRQTMATRLC